MLIDFVLLHASSNAKTFTSLLDDRTERAFADETFKPLYEGLTSLQPALNKPAGSGGYAIADPLFERWLKM